MKFTNYSWMKEKTPIETANCAVCQKVIPRHQKTCSLACAGRNRYKIDWDSINLVEALKGKAIIQLADELGCSDAAIHKRLKKLGLK